MSCSTHIVVPGSPWRRALTAWAVAWMLFGCVSDRPTPGGATSSSKGPVEQLHVLTGPTALNFDQVPGPDGFMARVYAASSRSAATVPILNGTLEVLMFDGVLKDENPTNSKPLRVWTYTASELKPFGQRASIGFAYVLTLAWGEARPTQDKITIVARYVPPRGLPIYSGPTSISLAIK